MARRFEFNSARILVDDRETYGEERLVATGFFGDRLHVLVYVERDGRYWVISLRRADRKEADAYVDYVEQGW